MCHDRYEMGRRARKRKHDEPFQGNPKQELLEELADGLNYLGELQKDGRTPLWVVRTVYDHLTRAAVLLMTSGDDD